MLEQDLLRFVWIADPQISPAGRAIVFTRVHVDEESDEYRTNLWWCDVPAAGAPPAPPRALTFGGRDSQPRWSPDGATLAFVRKAEAEAPPQILLLPLAGGEARTLTRLKGGAHSPAWSPDGRRIAFLSGHNPAIDTPDYKKPRHEPGRVVRHPEFRMNNEGFVDWDHLDHVWVIDAAGGEPRALTSGTRFKEWGVAWSRDGRQVMYLTDRREEPWFGRPVEDNDLRAVSPDPGTRGEAPEAQLVADIAGPIADYREAPDGRILAVGGVRPVPPRSYDQNELLLFGAERPSTSPRSLTAALDLAVGETVSGDSHPPRGGGSLPLAFTDDGGALFVHVARGASRLARLDLAGGRLESLTPERTDIAAGSVSAGGRFVALTLGSPASPGDLWVVDVGARRCTKLFAPNEALLESSRLGEVEEIEVPSFDGRPIHGWIVKPPDFDPARRYPMILEIHGGPHVPYGCAFFHEFRVLAAAGYVVLYTNPRGSTSYGQEFANVIQYRYPGDDHLDLMAAVDAVVAKGWVDPQRLGVTGGSGGGLLTNWAIAHTDRFRAAITQRCVSDWASVYYSSDFALFEPNWFRKPPFADPAEYAQRSPVHLLERIRTPLMVIHSEDDWRTPIAQGEVMFRGLKQQRKPVVMVRFPGENHELSRSGMPSRRVQNQQHIRRWFDRWLQDKPAPEYGV